MGVVPILLLVLAAGTRPCSSAQLSSSPFPRSKGFRKAFRRDFPFSLLPAGLPAAIDSPLCHAAQKFGYFTGPGEGPTAADALKHAADDALSSCKAKNVKSAETAKTKYVAAATKVAKSLGWRPAGALQEIGKIGYQLIQCEWTSALKEAANYWCGYSQATYTIDRATVAKKTMGEAKCFKKLPVTLDLDAVLSVTGGSTDAGKGKPDEGKADEGKDDEGKAKTKSKTKDDEGKAKTEAKTKAKAD